MHIYLFSGDEKSAKPTDSLIEDVASQKKSAKDKSPAPKGKSPAPKGKSPVPKKGKDRYTCRLRFFHFLKCTVPRKSVALNH